MYCTWPLRACVDESVLPGRRQHVAQQHPDIDLLTLSGGIREIEGSIDLLRSLRIGVCVLGRDMGRQHQASASEVHANCHTLFFTGI